MELRRVVERWQQLPLEVAQQRVPLVRELFDHLVAGSTPGAGAVPDLGPAAVPDQLTVLVHDLCATADACDLRQRLAGLRGLL